MSGDQADHDRVDAEDAGYISGELVRAVGEGATAYLQAMTLTGDAGHWGLNWAEFFNAAMDAVTERPAPAGGELDTLKCPDCFNADPSLDGPRDEHGHCVRCGGKGYVVE